MNTRKIFFYDGDMSFTLKVNPERIKMTYPYKVSEERFIDGTRAVPKGKLPMHTELVFPLESDAEYFLSGEEESRKGAEEIFEKLSADMENGRKIRFSAGEGSGAYCYISKLSRELREGRDDIIIGIELIGAEE